MPKFHLLTETRQKSHHHLLSQRYIIISFVGRTQSEESYHLSTVTNNVIIPTVYSAKKYIVYSHIPYVLGSGICYKSLSWQSPGQREESYYIGFAFSGMSQFLQWAGSWQEKRVTLHRYYT